MEVCTWPARGVALQAILFLVLAAPLGASPQNGAKPPANLGDASLEELMNVEVTSVSKKDEKLSQTAAAIYVITQEDIRRSGATTIPDLLRMAPGLDVAQIDTNIWAVSARGFNSRFANKLLVLVDGRSVYSEIFSGTFWDSQDMVLEDIDRIEVIRGPGATMWGADAVNGVVNIITKPAKDTQGGLMSAAGGAGERGFGELQYGGRLGSQGYYRAYAKTLDRGPELATDPGEAQGDWSTAGGGFRLDWNTSPRDSVLAEGNIYGSGGRREIDQVMPAPPFSTENVGRAEANGGSLMSRWQRRLSNGAEIGVQVSYDHAYRDALAFRFTENVADVDFHYRLPLGERNSLVWGLGYRFTDLAMNGTFGVNLSPQNRQDNLFQGFVQDEWALIPDRVTFTAGSKFEHNPFTGFEIQPGMRLAWTPAPLHTFWVAVSRAVRTPA
ncbi:MAG: TonB-dependent receptor plug domain-containing protein, partial [Bryobacteraceae bacterium]